MICADVYAALDGMDGGALPSPEALGALEAAGLVGRAVVPSGASGVEVLRQELKELQVRRDEARKALATTPESERAAAREAVLALDREERELRSAILELADLPAAAGTAPTLTVRGRDLRGELSTRIGRVADVELEVFVAQFEQFRKRLGDAAAAASKLLAELSPKLAGIDEIHLRSAVISLATTVGPRPAETVTAFSRAVEVLRLSVTDDEALVQLAEAFAAYGQGDPKELLQLYTAVRARFTSTADAAAGVAIAWGEGPAGRTALIDAAAAHRTDGGDLAPWVLFADGGRPDRRFDVASLAAEVLQAEPNAPAHGRWAGVLLALSPAPPEIAVQRFREVRTWLARFGTAGVTAPAAMLVLLDAGAPELLDDLRLASTAVREHRLSLSALENLALGVKLLVQVALGRGVVTPSGSVGRATAVNVGGTSVALPVTRCRPSFVQAVSTYHAATVHHRIVRHDWDHPVHTHRVYG